MCIGLCVYMYMHVCCVDILYVGCMYMYVAVYIFCYVGYMWAVPQVLNLCNVLLDH